MPRFAKGFLLSGIGISSTPSGGIRDEIHLLKATRERLGTQLVWRAAGISVLSADCRNTIDCMLLLTLHPSFAQPWGIGTRHIARPRLAVGGAALEVAFVPEPHRYRILLQLPCQLDWSSQTIISGASPAFQGKCQAHYESCGWYVAALILSAIAPIAAGLFL